MRDLCQPSWTAATENGDLTTDVWQGPIGAPEGCSLSAIETKEKRLLSARRHAHCFGSVCRKCTRETEPPTWALTRAFHKCQNVCTYVTGRNSRRESTLFFATVLTNLPLSGSDTPTNLAFASISPSHPSITSHSIPSIILLITFSHCASY